MKMNSPVLSFERMLLCAGICLVIWLTYYIIEPRLFWAYPYIMTADEPVFSRLATKIAAGHSWEPGWYGHPGTIMIYVHALGIVLTMILTGRSDVLFSGDFEFGQDPGDILVVGRLVVMLFGMGLLAYTYKICRLFSNRAIAFVAILLLLSLEIYANALGRYRTDIPQAFFMVMCAYHALRDDQKAWNRHRVISVVAISLAMLTKWPGVLCAVFVVYMSLWRVGEGRSSIAFEFRTLVLSGVMSVITAFVLAPRMFLDFTTLTLPQVLRENKTHMSQTSEGFVWAIGKYSDIVSGAVPAAVLIVALLGCLMVVFGRGFRKYAGIALMLVLYVLFISALTKWWTRWTIPLYPFIFMMFALGFQVLISGLTNLFSKWPSVDERRPFFGSVAALFFGALILIPNLLALQPVQAAVKNGSTRLDATNWALANIPKGSKVLIEKYTVQLSPADYELVFVAKRPKKLWSQKKPSKDKHFDSGMAALAPMGLDPDILPKICSENIAFVVTNENQYRRYMRAGEDGVLQRYAQFQVAEKPVAVFAPLQDGVAKVGPLVKIYQTQTLCQS